MNDPVLTLLGFARKAGKLAAGTAAVTESVNRHRSWLILTAYDISAKTVKELKFACLKQNITVTALDYSKETLSEATGTNAGIFSVEDEGFARAVTEKLTGGTANDG